MLEPRARRPRTLRETMPKRSVGLLLHRRRGGGLEVLLVHPGGPFWWNRDLGSWSIPKGVMEPDEEPLAAALREVREETGYAASGTFEPLTAVRQRSGKWVHAFAVTADLDADAIVSNTFELEWPPRSGRLQTFPEVDRAAWFPIDEARERIHPGQRPLLEELRERARSEDADQVPKP